MTISLRPFSAFRRNILLALCLVSVLVFSVVPVQAQLNFSRIASLPVGNFPLLTLPGDFNGDGAMDIATTDYGVNSGQIITVYYNNGMGNFGGATTIPVLFEQYYSAPKAAVADFNNDGKADIVALGRGNFVVCLSQGTGAFQQVIVPHPDAPAARVAASSQRTSNTEYGIVAADFDGNGSVDIAAQGNGGFFIILNQGNAVFGQVIRVSAPPSQNAGLLSSKRSSLKNW